MAYHTSSLSGRTQRALGAASGSVVVTARPGDPAQFGAPSGSTLPPGYNVAIAQSVMRYPQAELNALNNYELSGTIVYPNADLLIMSQVEMDGTCDDVFKKIFLVDLYERARAALRALLAYSPAPFEQKVWYDSAQAWMEIWCRSTAVRGGTFRSSMAEWRLLRMQPNNVAPFPEKSDGQTLFRSISTLQTSGTGTKTVKGTPWDFFGFQSDFDAPDGYENPNLAWPYPGPDEQYFGMPIWATFLLSKYEMRINGWLAANGQDPSSVIHNCGTRTPFGKNRGSLTGQRVDTTNPKITKSACMNSGDISWHWQDVMYAAFKAARTSLGLPGDDNAMNAFANGTRFDDDHDALWRSTSMYPVDVYVGLRDAQTEVLNTSDPYAIFYQSLFTNPSNPLAGIAAALGGTYWQTGTAATGAMMIAGIKPRMQEMAGLEFMQVQATALTQYAAFLKLPENVAVAGQSADQLAAAADAGAQAGVNIASQVTEGVGAAVALIPGVGTVIGAVIAGIGALLGIFGGLIHAQAWAPPPLWYRVLNHCKGDELRITTIADITAYMQQIKFHAQQQQKTIATVSDAFVNGVKGNGLHGQTKTWKLALWTLGGVSLVGLGAAIVKRKREKRA